MCVCVRARVCACSPVGEGPLKVREMRAIEEKKKNSVRDRDEKQGEGGVETEGVWRSLSSGSH